MKSHVLIVEDDPALRRSEALALKAFGFEVLEAPDGAVAVELFETHPIEAVVMDGKMPIMDGFEACGKIRAHPNGKAIPILMVTGMNETQAIESAYRAGATDFILKPVNLNVLSHRLKHLIENSRLQSALHSTRSTLESFFSAIPSAVLFCDSAWQIIDANPAAEALFGWPIDVMKDLPLKTLFGEAPDLSEITQALEKRGSLSLSRDYRFNTATEKPFWGEVVGSRVGTQGFILVVTNSTERRKMLEERERTAKLDLMGLLAGGIAHDFNNILTAVFSSLSLVQLEVPTDSRAARYLHDTQPALDQAKRLASQLLTFSKGGAPVRKLCDVSKLLRQTVEFSLRGSKIAAVYHLDESAFPAHIDEGQIVQVFSNLAVNAVQAMPRGGHLWVGLCNDKLPTHNSQHLPEGDYLKITVRDEGTGIPSAVVEKIFDPYFTTKANGSGLGLATVLSVVKRHQGGVFVTSSPGQGATFTLYLPAEPLSKRIEPLKPTGTAIRASHQIKRVLLLEDQELIRTAVVSLLERCGCHVNAFDDGARAVEAYRSLRNFDLVILDMTLPGGMSGLETLQALREIDPDVRAVVSTGYADDPVLAEPERYGFCGVLPKPYTFQALQELLAEISSPALKD